MSNEVILTKDELFISQAPVFGFEKSKDQILAEALEKGFVKEIGEDKYLLNENYMPDGMKFREVDAEEGDVLTVISKISDENLCDEQTEGGCEGKRYFSDGEYAITWHCEKHFKECFDKGIFVRV